MSMKRLLPAVFLLSGVSALIYQVVWQRLLATYYGVGPVSIALIVSVYIAGLGFGALIGGYASEKLRNKILCYCLIELCIGIFGLLSPYFLQILGKYTAGSTLTLSFIYISLFLFIPTLLMGMTLPLLIKIFSQTPANFFETVSFLYFLNTLGGAAGALIASYILISFFGLLTAVAFAASINFVIAITIYLGATLQAPGCPLARVFGFSEVFLDGSGRVPAPLAGMLATSYKGSGRRSLGPLIYPLVIVTGFLAIGYEVIWIRIIGVLVKDSPYAFSSILAVYLTGIAIGSHAMKRVLDRYENVNGYSLFFALQFLIGAIVCLSMISYFHLTKHSNRFQQLTDLSFGTLVHPGWYIDDGSIKEVLKDIFRSFDVFLWPLAFILVPTILMGASFPVVAALALVEGHRQGKTIGIVYFFTIIGNTLGGILSGFVLLPFFGTELTVALFSVIGIAFGMGVENVGCRTISMSSRAATTAVLLIGIVMFFPRKGELYEVMHASAGKGLDFAFEEGVDGTVVTYHRNERVRNFINGVAHGGRPIYSFYCETIEAMSRTPNLRTALVIGYGTGSIVETLLKSNQLKEVIIVEVNRTLLRNLRKIPLFATMLSNARVRLVVDDGRRYLFNTSKKFDLITTDALWSFTAYSNNLYSRDFYRLVQAHLETRGVYMAWHDEHRVIPKTLASVFSYVQMFQSFSIASSADMAINRERRQRLLNEFSSRAQKAILAYAIYVGDQSYIEHLTKHYPINREWEPWTEYYLGLRTLEWRLGAAPATRL
jgi:predicted membrane-bound spermidine synthase